MNLSNWPLYELNKEACRNPPQNSSIHLNKHTTHLRLICESQSRKRAVWGHSRSRVWGPYTSVCGVVVTCPDGSVHHLVLHLRVLKQRSETYVKTLNTLGDNKMHHIFYTVLRIWGEICVGVYAVLALAQRRIYTAARECYRAIWQFCDFKPLYFFSRVMMNFI